MTPEERLNQELSLIPHDKLIEDYGHLDTKHNICSAINNDFMGSLIKLKDYKLFNSLIRTIKFNLVKSKMHKDYKSSLGILVLVNGATTIQSVNSISDKDLDRLYKESI